MVQAVQNERNASTGGEQAGRQVAGRKRHPRNAGRCAGVVCRWQAPMSPRNRREAGEAGESRNSPEVGIPERGA